MQTIFNLSKYTAKIDSCAYIVTLNATSIDNLAIGFSIIAISCNTANICYTFYLSLVFYIGKIYYIIFIVYSSSYTARKARSSYFSSINNIFYTSAAAPCYTACVHTASLYPTVYVQVAYLAAAAYIAEHSQKAVACHGKSYGFVIAVKVAIKRLINA